MGNNHTARPDTSTKGRIEAFFDGVIAVAITLLVLDLRVPRPDGADTLMWANELTSDEIAGDRGSR